MFNVHHTVEVAYILVITMWGHTGIEWQYIGNQIALQQEMTEEQCLYLIAEDMWKATYENEFYQDIYLYNRLILHSCVFM